MNAKQVLLLLFFIILLSNCKSLKYLNPFDGFKSNPRMVETQDFEIKIANDSIYEELSSTDIYYYDKKGRIIKWEDNYGPERKRYHKGWHYEYDKNGLIVEFYQINLDGTIPHKIKYRYNKYGQLTGERIKNTTKKISYNRRDRTAQWISEEKNGDCLERGIMKYDKKWRETEVSFYDCRNNLQSRMVRHYSLIGNLTTSKKYDSENNLQTITKSEYNEYGLPSTISTLKVNHKDTVFENQKKWEYLFDSKENIIEKKLVQDGKIISLARNIITY